MRDEAGAASSAGDGAADPAAPPQATRPARRLHVERLLVGDRWEREVRVEVDARGRVASLSPGAARERAAIVSGWTVPGVPNVHSHAFQRALAGLTEGREPGTFWAWREAMYRFLGRLSPDDVEAIARQLYVELLKAGFTCVGEFHYLHRRPDGGRYDDFAEMGRRIAAAAAGSGIGLRLMPALYERGGFDGRPLQGPQRRFRLDYDGALELRDALRRGPSSAPSTDDVRLGWALHSLRANPRRTFARDFGESPVHVHVAEQSAEVRECVARRGARPVEWLLERAAVDERWCLVHATHASEDEVARAAATGAVVGLCPTTEANLGDGLFRLPALAAAGGRFGIGTDSHVSRSPVEELRLLEYGQRLVARRRRGLLGDGERSPGERRWTGVRSGAGGAALTEAWRGGARALAWNAGAVEVGRRADLVVLDADHPTLLGREGSAVLDSWVFSGAENPVKDVMVAGRWVVENGRHRREREIEDAYAKVVERLRTRM